MQPTEPQSMQQHHPPANPHCPNQGEQTGAPWPSRGRQTTGRGQGKAQGHHTQKTAGEQRQGGGRDNKHYTQHGGRGVHTTLNDTQQGRGGLGGGGCIGAQTSTLHLSTFIYFKHTNFRCAACTTLGVGDSRDLPNLLVSDLNLATCGICPLKPLIWQIALSDMTSPKHIVLHHQAHHKIL